MEKGWFIFIVIVLFLILLINNFTGYNIIALGFQGGRVDYKLQPTQNFIQCFDGDPNNNIEVKGVCHAQYYIDEKDKLRGANAVDYCKSETEVVDFYCGRNFNCWEKVSECEDGFVCDDGRCVEKENELLKILDINELRDSFARTFG